MTYYVTTTDKFLSGWGRSEGKKNKLIMPCKNYDQALIVYNNAKARGDQKNVNIRSTKPYYNPKTTLAQTKTIKDMPNWYQVGYFKKKGSSRSSMKGM